MRVQNPRISEVITDQVSTLIGLPLDQLHGQVEGAIQSLYEEAASNGLEVNGTILS